MLIFPAIDLLGGRAVRLEQGRPESAKVYSDAPWELGARFADAGARRLHVVDLDAAFSGGSRHNRAVIARLADAGVELEVGGGIRSLDDCRRLVDGGARFVVLGTAAVKDPALVAAACAAFAGRVIVAVDAREGLVAVEGWTEATAATALEVGARVVRDGAAGVLYTDIGRDGMRGGPNLEATAALVRRLAPTAVIASGGVGTLADLAAVQATGASAVVVGKALYENAFTVEQAIARTARREGGPG